MNACPKTTTSRREALRVHPLRRFVARASLLSKRVCLCLLALNTQMDQEPVLCFGLRQVYANSKEQIGAVRESGNGRQSKPVGRSSKQAPMVASAETQDSGIDSVAQRWLSDHQSEFNLKQHMKGHGLDIALRYPASWRAEEGLRPHIVQKFVGDSVAGPFVSCMVGVMSLSAPEAKFLQRSLAKADLSGWLKEIVPQTASIVDAASTKIDGEPGVWVKFTDAGERAGFHGIAYCLEYAFCYRDRMVSIACSVAGSVAERRIVGDAFTSYLPVFQKIGNSIIIYEKWARANSKTVAMEGESMADSLSLVLMWGLLTWGIGLGPPLLIRFVFVKRALSKAFSVGLVAALFFLNILIFTALGSTTHGALVLVAFVSYAVLHARYRERLPSARGEATTSLPVSILRPPPQTLDTTRPQVPVSINDEKATVVSAGSTAASLEFFVWKWERSLGPYSLEQLQHMFRAGQLQATDLIWHKTLGKWTPLAEVMNV